MNEFFSNDYQENFKSKKSKIGKLLWEIENTVIDQPLNFLQRNDMDYIGDFPNPCKILKECIQEKLAIKILIANYKTKIARILRLLSAREERIIRMRFGIGMGKNSSHTWEEIAVLLSITKDEAVKLGNRAFQKLKYWSYNTKS